MDYEDVIVPTRLVLAGIVIGVLSGFAVAQFNPGPTLAAVVARQPFTVGKPLSSNLVKYDGRYWAVQSTPEVSLEPEATQTIRKVEGGETSFVTVATTSSGTYSNDAMFSGHVRYPGFFVSRVHTHVFPLTGAVLGWSKATGWTRIPLFSANSIGFLDTDYAPASRDGVCVSDSVTACR